MHRSQCVFVPQPILFKFPLPNRQLNDGGLQIPVREVIYLGHWCHWEPPGKNILMGMGEIDYIRLKIGDFRCDPRPKLLGF